MFSPREGASRVRSTSAFPPAERVFGGLYSEWRAWRESLVAIAIFFEVQAALEVSNHIPRFRITHQSSFRHEIKSYWFRVNI